MNTIEVTKPRGLQCNRLLDDTIKIIDNKKIKINHSIYVKIFSNDNLSDLTLSTDNVINISNNDEEF